MNNLRKLRKYSVQKFRSDLTISWVLLKPYPIELFRGRKSQQPIGFPFFISFEEQLKLKEMIQVSVVFALRSCSPEYLLESLEGPTFSIQTIRSHH